MSGNIALIGYRGTGKSTVAALVAAATGKTAVGLDALIEQQEGRPIPDIVASRGWDYFRQVESRVCREVCARDDQVIDTGGGVITRPENIAVLRDSARVVWLTATVPTIVARIADSTNRPALTEGKSFVEEVEEVLRQRTPLYAQCAHVTVATDGKTPERIAQDILAALGA